MGKVKKYIIVIICAVVGGSILGYGVTLIFQAKQCKNWTIVKGAVIDSYVVEISDLSNNKTTETALPDIKYEYSFKGDTYFNHIIAYHGDDTFGLSDSYYAGTEDDIAKIISKYPLNCKVDVYVNPANPHQSLLDTGLKLPVFMPFLYGAFLLFVAFHIYLFGIVGISNKREV